ncbi:MAG: DNA polymerase III subunit alpha [Bacilli bacterium]|nr:DNA polymerase III subunit alpha [Bacilli bacterium]
MFIPLYNKSNYTMLSSLLKIDDIISYAKKNNLSHIALTDSNMFGVMEFIKKCEKEGIIPVIGLEIEVDGFYYVLYAKNYVGYQNLMKLSTIQSECKITMDDLKSFHKDLICVILYDSRDQYETLSSIFVDNYLGYSNKEEEKECLLFTKNIVFFQKNLYLEENDQTYLSYLYRIRDGKTLLDEVNYDLLHHELIINVEEYSSKIGIHNTEVIASMCKIEFPSFQNLLPIYDCEDPKKYLFELCKAGLSKRLGGEIPKEYRERLTYELTVINDMGFPNYFLVVYDFIRFAKKNKILVGPGRGSAAGSLVAYSLGITDIDPLKYDLLFERFLNPERKTMPDIDTDFPDNKRDLVIDYVKDKYGDKRVAGIITFGTMASKQVIRDVSRVLNIPLYKVDSLCKLIPNSNLSLKEIYDSTLSFKTRIDSDSLLSEMFSVALKLEGFPRHTSQHAAGIVICSEDLDNIVPLVRVGSLYLTGYSMEYLEELGLLKMDFLVIKNLTLIDNILNDIKKIYDVEIDFSKIPLDDKETLQLFERADTCGIFQFESSGMRNFLRQLKPNSFEDIVSSIALFRPGAAQFIDPYIKRKHGLEQITYLDPCLEEVTKNTYGVLIYQEQIMQLAHAYAGYSLGEADILRRAMSKKKLELLQSEEERFVEKSKEMGHDEKHAKEIFQLVLQFAGYGFNKSHSVVYSVVAYKMGYLKCHYPVIFFSNLLSNVIGSDSKTYEYILEAKKEKIIIEKPSIQNSEDRYIIKDNKIIYPLSNIKSIGVVVVEEIKNAKEGGEFTDLLDCFSRLCISGVTKKVFETLIYADVFRDFSYNRKTLIENLDNLYNYAELTKDIDPSLVMKPDLEVVEEYDDSFLLQKEKDVFGFYFSSHPTTFYRGENPNCISLIDVDSHFNQEIDVLILVDKMKKINTKKGDKMCFLTGSDESDSKEFVLFPKLFTQYDMISIGNVLKIRGKVEKRLNEIQIVVNKIKILQGENNE